MRGSEDQRHQLDEASLQATQLQCRQAGLTKRQAAVQKQAVQKHSWIAKESGVRTSGSADRRASSARMVEAMTAASSGVSSRSDTCTGQQDARTRTLVSRQCGVTYTSALLSAGAAPASRW